MKRKRNQKMIKLLQKSDRSSVSNIVESSANRNDGDLNAYSTLKNNKSITDNSMIQDNLIIHKKNIFVSKNKNNYCKLDSITKSYSSFENQSINVGVKQQSYIIDTSKEKQMVRKIYKDKTVIDEKKYRKRKVTEEEEATKIEKQTEKRKKLCLNLKRNLEINENDKNISKTNISINLKHSPNLLSYFRKTTPEQMEKEQLKKNKVIVKAEIHTPQNLFTNGLSDNGRKENPFKQRTKLISKKFLDEYDEICLVQSETLLLSPSNEKANLCVQQNKPKWSLKIQLQSNGIQEPDIQDDEMYTPTALSVQLEDHIKCSTIPKILLPMKNRNENRNKLCPLINENQSKGNKYLKTIDNSRKDIIKKNKALLNDCLIIEGNILKETSAEKLAPLFRKKVKADTDFIAAKCSFLQADFNDNNNSSKLNELEIMEPKSLPFPKISHINQITPDIHKVFDKTYRFFIKSKQLFEPSIYNLTMKTLSKLNDFKLTSDKIYQSITADTDFITHHSDVESLQKIVLKISQRTKVRQKKKMLTQKNNFSEEIRTNYLWVDKYKPTNSLEIIGNEAAALKLKTWLKSWQSLKNSENYSSSEEFYTSDCSSSSDSNTNQVAVLIGPHGSGKTASVYAVAQELGYKVLELNASSKRPGKKILKELEEATKSHRVKNFNSKNSIVAFKKIETANKIFKNSLIFMKDIDLIFEEDDGFVSATFQLASNTKRPVIMSLRNACSYLPKMAPRQLQINFQPVLGKKVIILLQLIAFAETGYQLSQNWINALCQDGDLRKSLLQLQYLLLSGKEHILHTSFFVNELSWKNIETYMYKPAIKANINKRKQFKIKGVMDDLVENIDNFALISNLMNINDPTSPLITFKFEPSTCLIENTSSYCSLENTTLEIGNWMSHLIRKSSSNICKEKNQANDENDIYSALPKKTIIYNIDAVLSKIASSSLNHQSIIVDYLPSIRNICRAEEKRNHLNSKRGNRFFHYLQNTRLLNETTKVGNIFSTACNMLQEKAMPVSKTNINLNCNNTL